HRRRVQPLDQRIDAGSRLLLTRAAQLSPEQQPEVRQPVRRKLEQRLEEQVLEQVVPPDVQDERDRRAQRRDVGEVLVRTHPDVRAAPAAQRTQVLGDVQVRRLVRDQVVRVEVAARLRQLRDQPRERAVRERRRRRGHGGNGRAARRHRPARAPPVARRDDGHGQQRDREPLQRRRPKRTSRSSRHRVLPAWGGTASQRNTRAWPAPAPARQRRSTGRRQSAGIGAAAEPADPDSAPASARRRIAAVIAGSEAASSIHWPGAMPPAASATAGPGAPHPPQRRRPGAPPSPRRVASGAASLRASVRIHRRSRPPRRTRPARPFQRPVINLSTAASPLVRETIPLCAEPDRRTFVPVARHERPRSLRGSRRRATLRTWILPSDIPRRRAATRRTAPRVVVFRLVVPLWIGRITMLRTTRSTVLAAAVLALWTAACTDVPGPAAPASPLPEASPGAIASPMDAVAREVPAFGGFFLDENGTPTAYLTDVSQRARLERALAPILREHGFDVAQLRVRPAAFRHEELQRWLSDATPEVLGLP